MLQVFEQFLAGDTLEECYAAVASVADRWLDLLDTQVISYPRQDVPESVKHRAQGSKRLRICEGRHL